jgi:hypothetical protein
MKNLVVVLALIVSLVFVGCASSSSTTAPSKKTQAAETFENFGFEGVRQTKDLWMVTGFGEDVFFDNLPDKALENANKKFALFLKNRKFPVPTAGKKMIKHLENGKWGEKIIYSIQKNKVLTK